MKRAEVELPARMEKAEAELSARMEKAEVELSAKSKNTEVELSARMKALVDLVTPGRVVCDIGCDHGFVSIYLVQKGLAARVYAMDVRSGPLSRARDHIAAYGLEQQIEPRLSDGFQNLKKGEADCAICAGMGGPLMIKILREGREKVLAMKELILQPQSEIGEFRKYLRINGYHIIKEDMVFEDGKYYPMMKVVPGELQQTGGDCFSQLSVNREESDCLSKLPVKRKGEETHSQLSVNRETEYAEMSPDTERENPEEFAGTADESPEIAESNIGGEEFDRQQMFDTYGQYLLEYRHPVLKQYLDHSKTAMTILCDKLKAQQGERAMARLPEIEAELVAIENALRYFEI